jgi:D-alanine transaminase
MQQIAMINEKLVGYEDLDPVYLDRGFYFGDGVYEVLRSYNGKIFAIDEHMERFSNSLSAIGINTVNIDHIRQKVVSAFEQSQISNARIYFHITRGSAPRNHSYSTDIKPNFFMTIIELPDSTKSKLNGIAVSTFPDWRWKRCDIKSLNLLANVLARQDAESKGCEEAILVDENDHITEGAGSSFFAILNDTLLTAPLSENILPSITRKYVLKAADNISMKIAERSLTVADAVGADELFIGVTTKDIVPVVKFDDKDIGNNMPGENTKKLVEEFKQFTV